MRLRINLASQPYEVAQEYKRRLTALIAILGVIAMVLVGYILYQRAHSRSINRQVEVAQRAIDRLEVEEFQARAILGKPTNRVVADQSDFLNELFARKALSWTRIFTEMEKIVPPNLHVVSMKPEYTRTNDLVLHMVVATDARERAVELVRRMEKSNHFRHAQVVAEAVVANTSDQTGAAGNIQFDIAAIYVPGGADSEETPNPGGAKVEKTMAPSRVGTPVKKTAGVPGSPLGSLAVAPATVANSPAATVHAAQNGTAPSAPPVRARAD